jgi:hypothetical protein
MFSKAHVDIVHLLQELCTSCYAYSLQKILINWTDTRYLSYGFTSYKFENGFSIIRENKLIVRFFFFTGHFAKHLVSPEPTADS